jgi:hypothetical protein
MTSSRMTPLLQERRRAVPLSAFASVGSVGPSSVVTIGSYFEATPIRGSMLLVRKEILVRGSETKTKMTFSWVLHAFLVSRLLFYCIAGVAGSSPPSS